MTRILKGAEVASAIYTQLTDRVAALQARGVVPCLAIVRVGARDDDVAYESSVAKRCESLGVRALRVTLPGDASQSALLKAIDKINRDASVHACLPLRPLPARFDDAAVRNALSPEKDADGMTDASLLSTFIGAGTGYPPCTPRACMELLSYYGVPLSGRRAVVVGRSLVVGKPLAMMLLAENATVTVCHSKTERLPAICREANVLVVAVGRAGVVKADCFASGQTVIDVGFHMDADGRPFGDVDCGAAESLVDAISPVPGGVGAVTTAVLVRHVVMAAEAGLLGARG